jgi:hypothetical protein
MRKGRFSEEQIINVKGGPAAAQLHLTPRRNRFRQRPVQVRTRLSAGGKWIRTLGPAGKPIWFSSPFVARLVLIGDAFKIALFACAGRPERARRTADRAAHRAWDFARRPA